MNDAETVQSWLSALERELAGLPEAARRDIVSEARTHLEDRLSAGLPASSALHGFGSVKDYARPFVEDHMLTHAMTSKRSLQMVKVLFIHSAKGLAAMVGLTGAAVFAGLTFVSVTLLIDKLFNPDAVGYFTAPGYKTYIGRLPAHATNATDHLGWWFYVIMAVAIPLSLLLARLCLRMSGFAIVRARKKAA